MKMFPHPAPQPEPEIALVDNPFAPEVLTTGSSGMSLINGMLMVTFESVHCDHSKTPPPLERVVVARLGMPISAAQGLLMTLHQFLGQHGLSPLATPRETVQ